MPLPRPGAKSRSLVEIVVAPDAAAKLAVLEAFAAADIREKASWRAASAKTRKNCVASSIGPTKLAALTAALRALGKGLVVGVVEAEAA
ncbi:MAG: hypothetical protein RO009_00925 [Pseudorhodoplanes sp.]|nr:hypothetical protein [Pseudorhodoplanes sp.]